MSANIKQIFDANPTTIFQANDLMYLGRSPYGATDDFAFTYSSLIPVSAKGDIFTWSTAATKLSVGSNSTILMADSVQATGLKWTTATYPATTTINQLLYSSAANAITGLTTAANAVLITLGVGDPTWSTSLPNSINLSTPSAGNLSNCTGVSLTSGVTGVLPIANGGTAISTYALGDTLYASAANTLANLSGNITTSKMFLSQTGTGLISAAPVWEVIDGTDINGVALTKVDDTNVTLTLGGTPATALLQAVSLTLGWTGTLAVSRGGTGTGTAFIPGSVVFAGTAGTYTQDNANFFWDDTNNRLGLGTTSPSQRLDMEGVFNIFDTAKTYPAGISTEVSSSLINFGINDSRFGTVTAASQGGYIRMDARAGQHLYQFSGRPASGVSADILRLTSDGDVLFGPGSLGTTAVAGFPFMPSCAGTPTGVPAAYAGGFTPFIWDQSNNRMYAYNSGWLNVVGDGATTITTLGTVTTGTWNATTIGVPYGGTGNTTFTAYSVICAGTTATDPFQNVSGLGTSGYVLTSNGAGTLPTWQVVPTDSITIATDFGGPLTGNSFTFTGGTSGLIFTGAATTATLTGTLNVGHGGTGTTSQFTEGSVVFAGTSGVYNQDNANLFWDNTNNRLGIGNAAPTTAVDVTGTVTATLFSGSGASLTSLNGSNISTGTVAVGVGGTGQTTYTDGQLLIGNSTGNTLTKTTLTAGTGISITNGSGSITISSPDSGIAWSEVTGTSASLSVNNGYVINNAGLVTLTLPTTAALGDVISIRGLGAGGFTLVYGTGQMIHIAPSTTTTTTGSLSSTNRYDSFDLTCVVANTEFSVTGLQGILTIV